MITYRNLRVSECPAMNRMYNRVFGEWLLKPADLIREEPDIYGPANLRHCWGAFDGKRLVAHVAARRATVAMEGATLLWASYGNVMTDPAYRGKGIATKLNRMAWGRLREEGVDGVYISGGRGLYRRMGAVPCGDYEWFRLKYARVAAFPLGALRLRRCGPADAETLARLHRPDRACFLRNAAEFHGSLATGRTNLRPARVWLVTESETPVAYVVASPLWAKTGPERGPGDVVDYAGARAAVVRSLPEIMRREGWRGIGITVATGDKELRGLLRGAGLRGRPTDVKGTQLLLNPTRLVRRLRPYFEKRLGVAAARWLKFPLHDRRRMTRLLLGPTKRTAALPIPFPPLGLNWM